MNLIAERRQTRTICHKCFSPDYRMEPPNFEGGKPNFVCNSCGEHWQYGYDGGIYADLSFEKNKEV